MLDEKPEQQQKLVWAPSKSSQPKDLVLIKLLVPAMRVKNMTPCTSSLQGNSVSHGCAWRQEKQIQEWSTEIYFTSL